MVKPDHLLLPVDIEMVMDQQDSENDDTYDICQDIMDSKTVHPVYPFSCLCMLVLIIIA